MTSDTLEKDLLDFVIQTFYLEQDDIQADTPLFSTNLLDSFNMLEVVTFVEKKTGLAFGAMDLHLGNLDSVRSILDFIESKSG